MTLGDTCCARRYRASTSFFRQGRIAHDAMTSSYVLARLILFMAKLFPLLATLADAYMLLFLLCHFYMFHFFSFVFLGSG